jgi:hypothetical protein
VDNELPENLPPKPKEKVRGTPHTVGRSEMKSDKDSLRGSSKRRRGGSWLGVIWKSNSEKGSLKADKSLEKIVDKERLYRSAITTGEKKTFENLKRESIVLSQKLHNQPISQMRTISKYVPTTTTSGILIYFG